MPRWLYQYFGSHISPLIHQKDPKTHRLLPPPSIFDKHTPSFWVYAPEPTIILSRAQYNPLVMYRPRVYLWLPHFLVANLLCPHCNQPLEKNGALPPRRIYDMDDVFYIITWAYNCRKGYRHHTRGWNSTLLDSLPAYVRLAFPAILSRKAGMSQNLMSVLRVGNQHKMGPSGVHTLLYETYTLRYNALLNQYLEAIFERTRRLEVCDSGAQTSLDKYQTYAQFGDFGAPEGYSGVVPTVWYLSKMMMKAIEQDEAAANQHTACLAPDQIAIDDSHKVSDLI